MSDPKLLIVDIETAPNLAHVWRLHGEQHIGLDQLATPSRMICWAAKWKGERRTEFRSGFHDGQEVMIGRAHELLSEADIVMHYNGKRFDIPILNGEFLLAGLRPPAPYRQIDLWQVVSRVFRFPSSKLDYVLKALGLKTKVQTGGFQLWLDCMANDPKAWARMCRYNKRDVTALDELHDYLLPWIPNYPSRAIGSGFMCPRCGSSHLQCRGYNYTAASKYQRYQCQDCGGWSQDTRRISGADIKQVAA
jgi:hypothetical protein